MARRSPQTFQKRLREHKREEKNRAKQLKRDQRKAAAQAGLEGPPVAQDEHEHEGEDGDTPADPG